MTDEEIEEYKNNADEFKGLVFTTYNTGTSHSHYLHLGSIHVHSMLQKSRGLARYSNHSLESLHALNKQILRTKTSKFKDYSKGGWVIALKQLQTFSRLIAHGETLRKLFITI